MRILVSLFVGALCMVCFASATLPTHYDGRKQGIITSAKDQGQTGACWAFANIGCIEANMQLKGLTTNSVDFSESHFAYFTNQANLHTGDGSAKSGIYGYYGGSNFDEAVKCLGARMGVELEVNFPYKTHQEMGELNENARYNSFGMLRMAKKCNNEIDSIKTYVLKYGSVGTGIQYAGAYLANGIAYYCPMQGNNHYISIVGWDDEYGLENFNTLTQKPTKPGAWICKNSYGTVMGDMGFFYVSYEDKSLSDMGVMDMMPGDYFDQYYQHDGRGWNIYEYNVDKAANAFVAQKDEYLSAFSLHNTGAKNYTLSIYIQEENEPIETPESGRLAYSQSGKIEGMFEIIELDQPLKLNQGDRFFLVLELDNRSFCAEPYHEHYTIHEGESFIFRNGQWTDCATTTALKNISIKAYSSNSPDRSFSVKYQANGGLFDIAPYTTKYGSLITSPDHEPTRNGYTFEGWYRDRMLTTRWDYDRFIVTAPTTLYARWSRTQAESITLTEDRVELLPNESYTLNAIVLPASAIDQTVVWQSSHPEVASIDQHGVVSAGTIAGTTTITARDAEGHTTQCIITLRTAQLTNTFDLATSVDITEGGYYLIQGNGTETSNTISVATQEEVTLYLRNVSIKNKLTPLTAKSSKQISLVLLDRNSLICNGSNEDAGERHGVTAPDNGTLIIEGNGSLYTEAGHASAGIRIGYGCSLIVNNGIIHAYGAKSPSNGYAGAGIGGEQGQAPKSVTINGGTVVAIAGAASAGIGGCGNANPAPQSIRILGGSVHAKGGSYCSDNHFGGGMGGEIQLPFDGENNLYTTYIDLPATYANSPIRAIELWKEGKQYPYGCNMTVNDQSQLILQLPLGNFGIAVTIGTEKHYYTCTVNALNAKAQRLNPSAYIDPIEENICQPFTLVVDQPQNYTSAFIKSIDEKGVSQTQNFSSFPAEIKFEHAASYATTLVLTHQSGLNITLATTQINVNDHPFDQAGFCTLCGAYQPAPIINDTAQISNSGQLYWFTQSVNNNQTTLNGTLTQSIVINENVIDNNGTFIGDKNALREWQPIGSIAQPYQGYFNGNGYTIEGVFSQLGGLFGAIANQAHIQQIGLVNSYIQAGTEMTAGALCNLAMEESVIEHCYNSSTIESNNSLLAGICGKGKGSIQNCYNIGLISGTDCTIAPIANNWSEIETVEIFNCYYLDQSSSTEAPLTNMGQPKSQEEFIHGNVAHQLQGTNETLIWGQRLTNAQFPYPVCGKQAEQIQVFKIEFINEPETTIDYANSGAITFPEVSQTGLSLYGWCDAPTGGNKYESSSILTQDIFLYAQWEIITATDSGKEETLSLSIQNGTLYINGDFNHVAVYDATGKSFYSGRKKEIKLPQSALYLVKIDSKVYKMK